MIKFKKFFFITYFLFFIFSYSNLKYAYAEENKVVEQYPLTPAMYEILGMTDEYCTRWGLDFRPEALHVESFYLNEEKLADLYEKLIINYKKESEINFKYKRITQKSGHIVFRSEKLANIINSFYEFDGQTVTLKKKYLIKASNEEKFLYILGVYRRYGLKNNADISMSNASEKMLVIGEVLKSLGCNSIKLYRTIATIPIVFYMYFKPTQALKKKLKLTTTISKPNFKFKKTKLVRTF